MLVIAGIAFLLLPLAIILVMSFNSAQSLRFPPPGYSLQYYEAFFTSDAWRAATRRSFQVGVPAALIATTLAIPAAYAVARYRSRFAPVAQLFLLIPMMMPLIIIAIAAFLSYAPLGLTNRLLGLTLVHGALGLPLAFLTVSASLANFDFAQERAARSLGSSGPRAFVRVVGPQLIPGIVGGGLLAFLTSFDEVIVAIFLAGRQETIPRRMWDGILVETDPIIPVISSVLVAFTVLLFLAARLVQVRQQRRMIGEGND